jgi:glycosyltransferase involved in cell wall biosynthesis
MEPLVSIIIPVYNRGELIKETLDSVFYQTYTNWECIIVDDGSTDDTWLTLQNYELKDIRFKIFKRQREPKGASVCRNIGIEKVNGEYIMFLDSDDLLLKNCLKVRLDFIKKNPFYDAWIFATGIFKESIGDMNLKWNNLSTTENDLIRFLRHDIPWDITGPIWRYNLNENKKWFNENALFGQDWEMHVNKLLSNIKYLKYHEDNLSILNYCRRHQNVKSITNEGKLALKFKTYQPILIDILKKIILKQDNNINLETEKLIFRQTQNLLKIGLLKEAKALFNILFLNKLHTRINNRFWLLVLFLKTRNNLSEKIIDFFVYKIIYKQNLFINNSTFMQSKIIEN